MPLYEKHFTVAEARTWLPKLRDKFKRIQRLSEELLEAREDQEKALSLVRSNGHEPKDTGFGGRMAELREIVAEINEAGIEVKDISRGLVDFPHLRDGDEVLLCWSLEEPDIRYWHGIEEGYAGRTPL